MGAFGRSTLNNEMGARTQLSGLISAAVAFVTYLVVTPALFFLPKAVLAAIVARAMFKLIEVRAAHKLWKVSRSDLLVMATSFACTLLLGTQVRAAAGGAPPLAERCARSLALQNGVLIAIVSSIVVFIISASGARLQRIGRVPGTVIYQCAAPAPHPRSPASAPRVTPRAEPQGGGGQRRHPGGGDALHEARAPLVAALLCQHHRDRGRTHGNPGRIQRKPRRPCACRRRARGRSRVCSAPPHRSPRRSLLLRTQHSACHYVDSTGIETLNRVISAYHDATVPVLLCGIQDWRVRRVLSRGGVLASIGADDELAGVHLAVRRIVAGDAARDLKRRIREWGDHAEHAPSSSHLLGDCVPLGRRLPCWRRPSAEEKHRAAPSTGQREAAGSPPSPPDGNAADTSESV